MIAWKAFWAFMAVLSLHGGRRDVAPLTQHNVIVRDFEVPPFVSRTRYLSCIQLKLKYQMFDKSEKDVNC